MIHEIIQLKPSLWRLEIFIGSRKKTSKKLKNIFGESKSYYYNLLDTPCVFRCYSRKRKENFICLYMPDFDIATLVHELVHVYHHWTECIGWKEPDYNAQEIEAIFIEDLFTQIMKLKVRKK